MQLAIASTDTRIDNTHSRVTYFEERDIEAYYITDRELAELCRLAAERIITIANGELVDMIDNIRADSSRRVFM